MTELDKNKTLKAEAPAATESTSNKERWILLIVALIIILLDQWSKSLVESKLALYTYYAPFPALENIFRISHVTNTGVAFGLFPDGNLIFTLVALIVSIVIIVYNFMLAPGHRLLRLALGLQLGGALGNLIDRLQQGYVTDFMDFGPWPVWNIADLAVVSGTALLVWIMYREEREEKKRAATMSEPNTHLENQTEVNTQQLDESSNS